MNDPVIIGQPKSPEDAFKAFSEELAILTNKYEFKIVAEPFIDQLGAIRARPVVIPVSKKQDEEQTEVKK